MADKDFTQDADLLHLEMEYETRVFLNAGGCVSISQPDPYEGEIRTISLSRSQAEQVYLALQSFVEGR